MAAEESSFERAMSAVWETGTSIGVEILQQRGAREIAAENARLQLEQQALYTKLSQQSSNLGPNATGAGVGAATMQTRLMQGPQAVAGALGVSSFVVWAVALIGLGVLLVFLVLRKNR